MLQEERFEFILSELDQKQAVKVAELADELQTSQSTIRRDIAELHDQEKLRRVFGGAVSLDMNVTTKDDDVQTRTVLNAEAKEQIGQYAAGLIEEGDFVFLDAGTTTARIIPHLDPALRDTVKFVTNGIKHASALVARGFQVYVPGGELKAVTEAIVGISAVNAITRYNFSKSFVGVNGIDIKRGFTTPELDEAMVKEAVIDHSHTCYILADSAKFYNISSVSFGRLKDACIVTDHLPDAKFRNHTTIKEVNL